MINPGKWSHQRTDTKGSGSAEAVESMELWVSNSQVLLLPKPPFAFVPSSQVLRLCIDVAAVVFCSCATRRGIVALASWQVPKKGPIDQRPSGEQRTCMHTVRSARKWYATTCSAYTGFAARQLSHLPFHVLNPTHKSPARFSDTRSKPTVSRLSHVRETDETDWFAFLSHPSHPSIRYNPHHMHSTQQTAKEMPPSRSPIGD